MVAATLILLLALATMFVMISGTDYSPLFNNIASDQTSVLMAKLQAKNIPFRIEDGGKTILVPKDLVASTQMAMMAEIGNSKLGTVGGLESFEKADFWANLFCPASAIPTCPAR